MTDPEPGENGYQQPRLRLPIWITIVSILLAIGSVSVLVLVLYEETKGPAEILREFARRVDRDDCAGSYELLDEGWRAIPEEEWCTDFLSSIDEGLDADFTLEHAVLEGDVAELEISGVAYTKWGLSRYGERSWRVRGAEDVFGYTDD
jgi:hypothetical protein